MHYYSFNIGDYASHTSRLSPIEDIAYRRMLDLYYLSEQPLNGSEKDIAREIGLIDYLDSVTYVLSKFFTKEENLFTQKRIDVELKKYALNAKNKRKAGKASAKARQDKAFKGVTGVEQVLNRTSTDEQLNIKHKPLTINQEPLFKDKPLVDDSTDMFEEIVKPKRELTPYQQIADLYNEILGNEFGSIKEIGSVKRKSSAKKLWAKVNKDSKGIRVYFEYFGYAANDHQRGKDGPWSAKFDWITRPDIVERFLDMLGDENARSN